MTTPRRGSRGSTARSSRRGAGGSPADWSAAGWSWDPRVDEVRAQLRARRLRRAQQLERLRAEIAAAAARHPSRWEIDAAPA